MSQVICDYRNNCDESHMCGASKLHYPSDCEPCPFHADAKCIPVVVSNGTIIERSIISFKKEFQKDSYEPARARTVPGYQS